MFYEATVQFEREVGNGKHSKIKKVNERFLVDAMSTTEVEARVTTHLEGSVDEWKVTAIRQSRIVEVIKSKK